jgi:dTDP-4-amino-4,6-dideoxygalactose transaminase
MTTPIAISQVVTTEVEERLVLEVLRSGRLAQGPMVQRLEEGFRGIAGTEHAVAVSSGTTALVAAIAALGIGEGDEIITSPFTFVATLNAILEAGAVARFADIGDDFNMDGEAAEAALTSRTRALMPVHLYGLPADMEVLTELAASNGLAMVEDAAQAVGATVDARPVGSFGLGCFSLYATKNVTTGEGGIVTTDDADLADRLRVLRNQGMRDRYVYVMPGHNYRMTDLQAAVGVAQLERLAAIIEKRSSNAMRLTEELEGVDGLDLPSAPAHKSHVYNQYTIRVLPEALISRDELAKVLATDGIGTGIYYPKAVYDYPCYRSHPGVEIGDGCPAAERAASQVLSLPVHPGLSDGDISRIGAAVRAAMAT